jgi:hypothetical protein
MPLKEADTKRITDFVKKEPRTVQEVSRLINKSWLTADSYIKQIKERTGLIDIKTFRKGTQGALKLVFYNYSDSLETDDAKEDLYHKIKNGRVKSDFDFLEIFQFIQDNKKKCFLEEYDEEDISKYQQIISLFRQTEKQLYCFSGNLSFINMKEKNVKIIDVFEELLKRKVFIKILTRVNIASLSNINKLKILMQKYPGLVEIRHRYQPLRGFIVDDKLVRFKNEEQLKTYKKGELPKNTRIFYEVYDEDWVLWLQKVFWNLFRSSMDYKQRIKEIDKLF